MPVTLRSIAPFLIVDDLEKTLDFYEGKLGFEVIHQGGDGKDFWGMVQRDGVMLMFKYITPNVHAQPNHTRHEWARWDAYVLTSNPDSLYAEYAGKGVAMHRELADTEDGLRAFEVIDTNGYVLCFGRPLETSAKSSS